MTAVESCHAWLPNMSALEPTGVQELSTEWTQEVKQQFRDGFDYTVNTGSHKYTCKNHPQSGKTNYTNMLDNFSSPPALQVNLFCSVLLWLLFLPPNICCLFRLSKQSCSDLPLHFIFPATFKVSVQLSLSTGPYLWPSQD